MTQNEQMRDQVAGILLQAGWRDHSDAQWSELLKALPRIRQALAAEPATLVRLTEEDQVKIITFFLHCGLDNWQKLWQCSNAIMDTMVAKNGGTE